MTKHTWVLDNTVKEEKGDDLLEINYDFLQRFIRNIAGLFGDHCEIVIHDYRNGYEHTIVDIVNGEVTGRAIGGCPSAFVIEQMTEDIDAYEKRAPQYFTNSEKGKILKSATTFIKDDEGTIIGSVCVNIDVTDLMLMQKTMSSFLQSSENSGARGNEVLAKNVDELLKFFLSEAEEEIGKPASLMNKDEKIRALWLLNQKGIFKISKANVALRDAFQVSKYTLYAYLDEAKKRYGIPGQE